MIQLFQRTLSLLIKIIKSLEVKLINRHLIVFRLSVLKTMKVLINDLNQHRRDFIPVHLINVHLINNEQTQES